MHFREWLHINESIHIQDGILGRSRESGNSSEFSYGSGEYWSTYSIRPYSVHRTGFANMNDASSNIIAIIKTTPIFQDNGTDRAFIKALTEKLKNKGKTPLAYREGENSFTGLIDSLDFDDKDKFTKALQGDTEKQTQTPQMGKEIPNSTKASNVSFSRESGSWAYIFRTPYAMNDIKMVEEVMKESAQPMIDNDIMDFWQLQRFNNGRLQAAGEIVYSKRGKQEQDNETQWEQKAKAYMKFLAEHMLSNHPKAMNMVLQHIGKTESQNTRIKIEDLRKYVQTYHNESSYLNLFLDALKTDDTNKYTALELLADQKDPETATYQYNTINNDDYQHIVENPLAYTTDALEIFKMSPLFQKVSRENFAQFKSQYEENLNDALEANSRKLRSKDFEVLKELSEFIEIRRKDQIHDIHSQIKQKEQEDRKTQEERKSQENDMIERGRFMYMIAGDKSWKHIPEKYLDGDDVQIGEMATEEDLVDREDIFQAAHEKASEEAMKDAEEKKSINYGQDKEEVLSDLKYDIDDYVEDNFSDGEFENLSDEQSQKKVQDEYLDDFIRWKKEKLEKDEEEESWRYEPEAEQSDIWKYEKEMAEDKAYEEGLVIFKWPEENNEIDVWLHSKSMEKAREMIRRSLRIGMRTKDEDGEPKVRPYTKVVFVFHDNKPIQKMRAEEV